MSFGLTSNAVTQYDVLNQSVYGWIMWRNLNSERLVLTAEWCTGYNACC